MNQFKNSLPVFLAGAAYGLLMSTFVFASNLDTAVIERAGGLALLMSVCAGLAFAFSAEALISAARQMPVQAWKRVAGAVTALLALSAGIALMALSLSYSGPVKQYATIIGPVLSLVLGAVGGYFAGWALSVSTMKTPSTNDGSVVAAHSA
jgi:hypothetical protein